MSETKIESITVYPFDITVPFSSLVTIVFTNAIDESNINSYLTIRDRNLKSIPPTNISLSVFNSSDNQKWIGNIHIHQENLYYQDAQILGNYNNHYIVANINVDTVTTYTYSNEMRGPNNGTLIAHYKPCYKIERINTQIVNIFEEDISHNKCAIFGINEKTFETMVDSSNNTKMGYKNNGNYEFYNIYGEVILSNGIPDISKGYGSINSNAYTFRFNVGFISFTIVEHKHKETLIEIINRSLERWTSMVSKPNASKFININDYNNYIHQISFKVQNFDKSEGEVLSSIISNYGTTFGNIFPLTSEIILREGYLTDNQFSNTNNILSIKQCIQRAIGNILGIGHYWYLQTSPISYDVLDKPYYSGTHGVEKYEEFVTKLVYYKNRIIGMPIENYTENSLFIEEGDEGNNSKKAMVTINGLSHPGLDKELMTNWFDINNANGVAEVLPISIVSLGLLEDIGYDICYNAIDNTYGLDDLTLYNIDYEIYIDYDLSINMFERLTDVYIQIKNNYHVKISNPITHGDLDNLLNTYITTVINNSVNPINELIVTHNSDVDANWVSFNYVNGENNVAANILQNTNNETIASANDTRVYKFTTIKHDDGSITALLDKQINV
jgi:hypothetical protein